MKVLFKVTFFAITYLDQTSSSILIDKKGHGMLFISMVMGSSNNIL